MRQHLLTTMHVDGRYPRPIDLLCVEMCVETNAAIEAQPKGSFPGFVLPSPWTNSKTPRGGGTP